MILNPAFGEHGLINNLNEDIDPLNIQSSWQTSKVELIGAILFIPIRLRL